MNPADILVFQAVVMTTLRACPTFAAVSVCSHVPTLFGGTGLRLSGCLCVSEGFNGLEEENGEADAHRYKTVTPAYTSCDHWAAEIPSSSSSGQMRKNKRLLSVHPLDFDPDDYFPHSRRPSVQVRPTTPDH